MKTTPIIAILAAGASLSLSACKDQNRTTTPPPDSVIQPPRNPPPPIATNPPPQMATWDSVQSDHPEGATNPPIPFLYVTPEKECFKAWVSPFRAGGPDAMGDKVRTDCATEDCGTPIACPEDRAQRLLATWREQQAAPRLDDADSE